MNIESIRKRIESWEPSGTELKVCACIPIINNLMLHFKSEQWKNSSEKVLEVAKFTQYGRFAFIIYTPFIAGVLQRIPLKWICYTIPIGAAYMTFLEKHIAEVKAQHQIK